MKNLLLIQPTSFLKGVYPKAIWHFERTDKVIYLTFDDGPIPGLTEWILEELKRFNAKATFFCVGANILKHNTIFEQVKRAGHTVANHTMHHVKGFQMDVADYLLESEECRKLVNNNLFRPPYGQLKPNQYKAMVEQGYKVVFWDVISYDYEKISPKSCVVKVIKNCKPGSVVLFHDNLKAEKNVKYSLPLVLKYYSEKGYRFEAIKP
ncbi:MAG: polysaccharide deacetylase family protein [Bacteroidia bacterium]|nr:polysaccharide deacetylase family protein [Bacteroidia bacterium]